MFYKLSHWNTCDQGRTLTLSMNCMPFPRFISLAKTARHWSYLSYKVFQTPKDTKCIVTPSFIAFGTTYQIKAIK